MRIARGISVTNTSRPVGISYDADAAAFFTAASITDTTQKSAVNTLVLSLKSANIWTKMKALYPVVGGVASAHAVNLKTPGTYNLTFATGWTHASTGMTPNGATYADSNIIPSSVLTLNSTHFSFYSRTNANPGGLFFGSVNSIQTASLQCSVYGTNNGSIYDSYNTITGQGRLLGSNVADSRGFAVFTRSASNLSKIFWNNVLNGSITTSGGALPNTYKIALSARNYDGVVGNYDTRQCAFGSIGDGLTDAEASSFYSAVQNYQTTLGRQV
jgi:hypothetical protein